MDSRGRVFAYSAKVSIHHAPNESSVKDLTETILAAVRSLDSVRDVHPTITTDTKDSSTFHMALSIYTKQVTLRAHYSKLAEALKQIMSDMTIDLEPLAKDGSNALSVKDFGSNKTIQEPKFDTQWFGCILPVTYSTDTIYELEKGQEPPVFPDVAEWCQHLKVKAYNLACAKNICVVPNETHFTVVNNGIYTEPPNFPPDSPYHIQESLKSRRYSVRFDVYIETHKKPSKRDAQEIIVSYSNLIAIAPRGYHMFIYSSGNKCLVTDFNTRTPWPLITGKTVPLGVNMNTWMQEQSVTEILDTRIAVAAAKGTPQSIHNSMEMIAKWERFAETDSKTELLPFLQALKTHLETKDLQMNLSIAQETLDSLKNSHVGLNSLIQIEEHKMEQQFRQLAENKVRNSELKKQVTQTDNEWDELYASSKNKKQ